VSSSRPLCAIRGYHPRPRRPDVQPHNARAGDERSLLPVGCGGPESPTPLCAIRGYHPVRTGCQLEPECGLLLLVYTPTEGDTRSFAERVGCERRPFQGLPWPLARKCERVGDEKGRPFAKRPLEPQAEGVAEILGVGGVLDQPSTRQTRARLGGRHPRGPPLLVQQTWVHHH
jgi:hypothetical protein